MTTPGQLERVNLKLPSSTPTASGGLSRELPPPVSWGENQNNLKASSPTITSSITMKWCPTTPRGGNFEGCAPMSPMIRDNDRWAMPWKIRCTSGPTKYTREDFIQSGVHPSEQGRNCTKPVEQLRQQKDPDPLRTILPFKSINITTRWRIHCRNDQPLVARYVPSFDLTRLAEFSWSNAPSHSPRWEHHQSEATMMTVLVDMPEGPRPAQKDRDMEEMSNIKDASPTDGALQTSAGECHTFRCQTFRTTTKTM